MQVAPRTALLSVVAGVGISIVANAIAAGFGDADFLLRSDLLWTGRYPIFVAPVLITLLATGSTAWRTSCDWRRHRSDTPLSIG